MADLSETTNRKTNKDGSVFIYEIPQVEYKGHKHLLSLNIMQAIMIMGRRIDRSDIFNPLDSMPGLMH